MEEKGGGMAVEMEGELTWGRSMRQPEENAGSGGT